MEERPHYIYLLYSKVHINSSERVYKIGKTRNFPARFNNYPKGSRLLGLWNCEDCNVAERRVLEVFREKFEARRDAGLEYFQGDWKEMRNTIHTIICQLESDDDVKEQRSKVVLIDNKAFILSIFE